MSGKGGKKGLRGKTKKAIPKALQHQVWLKYCGETFEHKCLVAWCKSKMTVFTFEVGHNVPESKGGATTLKNLRPICAQCNRSMGDRYTIDEWSQEFKDPKKSMFGCLWC